MLAADRRTMRRVDHNPRGPGAGRHRDCDPAGTSGGHVRRARQAGTSGGHVWPGCWPPTAGLCAAWITIRAGRVLAAGTMRRVDHNPRGPGAGRRPTPPDWHIRRARQARVLAAGTMRRVDHNPRGPGVGRRPTPPDCDPAGTSGGHIRRARQAGTLGGHIRRARQARVLAAGTMRRVDHNPRGPGAGRHRCRRIVIRRAHQAGTSGEHVRRARQAGCWPPTDGLCAAWITIHAGRVPAADRRRRIVIRRARQAGTSGRVPAADRRTMRRVDHNPRGPGAGRRPTPPDCDPAGTSGGHVRRAHQAGTSGPGAGRRDYAPRGSQSTRAGCRPPTDAAGL